MPDGLKKLLVLHTGDDPEFGGIQRMCFDAQIAFKDQGILGPSLGPKRSMISWIYSYWAGSRNWEGGMFLFHVGLAKLFWFRKPKKPVFIFLHGVEVWRPFPWYQTKALEETTKFIVNTKFTWERFCHWHPNFSKIPFEVVHLGLNSPVDFLPPDKNLPAALVISRLDKGEDYKGHREMITVWPRIREKIPQAELWIAGDGDLKNDLMALAQGTAGIHFLGRVSPKEKEERLRRCRCLAMPSRGEGFGLVYIEAMRYGRPCLVSDEDAGREVVNPPEAGLEVNQKDLASLCEKLQFLLGDSPEREAMGHRAKARFDDHFTLKHYQDRMIKAVSDW